MSNNPENINRLYQEESLNWKEKKAEIKEKGESAKKLANNIAKIENKLTKLWPWGKEFFEKAMNDYLQEKYKAKFEVSNWHLQLVFSKEAKISNDIKTLSDILKVEDNGIFLDENENSKMDKDEIWLNINWNKIETNAIYVDSKELRNKSVSFWKDTISNETFSKDTLSKVLNGKWTLKDYTINLAKELGIKAQKDKKVIFNILKETLTDYDWVGFVDLQSDNVQKRKYISEIYSKLEEKWYIKTVSTEKNRQILDKDYTKDGHLVFEGWKTFYEVGKNEGNWKYDHLAAVSRLFTSLSEEFFWGMSLDQINKNIKNLYFNKKTNEFKIFNDPKKVESGYDKVWDMNSEKWYSIVKPWAKINITSLSTAVTWKEKSNESTEKMKENDWGRFYMSGGKEIWDIPDDKTIKYEWYSKTYDNLKWNQISISADSLYDLNNSEKWLKGANTFSFKNKIKVWTNDAYLVVGEHSASFEKNVTKDQKFDNDEAVRKFFNDSKSKTEAWLVIPGEDWKWTIKEVGDKAVHTITETSDTVERWEDSDHPIVLEKNDKEEYVYKFEGEVNWSLKFTKDGQISKSSTKLSKEDFEKVFPGWKGYVAINGEVYKLSWWEIKESWKKTEWIVVKDLNKKYNEKVEVGSWVSIFDALGGKLEVNGDHIKFPELVGWGRIEGDLKKKNDKLYFELSDKYKVGDYKIKINIKKLDNENIKVSKSDILWKVLIWLALLGDSKTEISEWNKLYQKNKDKKTIDVNLPNLDKSNEANLATYDTYISNKLGEIKNRERDFLWDSVREDINKKLKVEDLVSNSAEQNINSKKTNKTPETKPEVEKLSEKDLKVIEDIFKNINLSSSVLKDKWVDEKWLKEFGDNVEIHSVKMDQTHNGLTVKFDFDDKNLDETYNEWITIKFSNNEIKDLKSKLSSKVDLLFIIRDKTIKEAIPQA